MLWLRENWFWIVVSVAFVWLHWRMHGGHGDHRHHTPTAEDSDHDQH